MRNNKKCKSEFTDKDREALLFLSLINGFGSDQINLLMEMLKKKNCTPAEFLNLPEKVRQMEFAIPEKSHKLINNNMNGFKKIDSFLLTLKNAGIEWRLRVDKDYPPALNYYLAKYAPKVIFLKGNANLLSKPLVAIIGTRGSSRWGEDNTEEIAKKLGEMGMLVISGSAKGIDTSAHLGVLEGGSKTIFVPGKSLLSFKFPLPVKDLISRENHLILSPFPPDVQNTKDLPIRRNPVVAALASSILVGECGLRGGSSYVVHLALKAKKPLYVIADSRDNFKTTPIGNKSLLSCGAIPIDISNAKESGKNLERLVKETEKNFNSLKGKIDKLSKEKEQSDGQPRLPFPEN